MEKIAYSSVLHWTKKNQFIKARTSMYIMNNQEENIIFFHCNHSNSTGYNNMMWHKERISQTSLALAKYSFRFVLKDKNTSMSEEMQKYRCSTLFNTRLLLECFGQSFEPATTHDIVHAAILHSKKHISALIYDLCCIKCGFRVLA